MRIIEKRTVTVEVEDDDRDEEQRYEHTKDAVAQHLGMDVDELQYRSERRNGRTIAYEWEVLL